MYSMCIYNVVLEIDFFFFYDFVVFFLLSFDGVFVEEGVLIVVV